MTNWLTTPLASFDLETTGIDPVNLRIVSFSLFTSNGKAHTAILNPGCEIPTEASDIHGITTERAIAEGMDYAEGVKMIADLLRPITYSHPIVAFNGSYDFTAMYVEMARLGLPSLPPFAMVDPFIIDKHYDKWRKGGRKLTDVSEKYGVKLTNAHDAVADTIAALEVARAILVKYGRGISPRELHRKQVLWAAEQRESFRAYKEKKGEPIDIDFGWPIYDRAIEAVKAMS